MNIPYMKQISWCLVVAMFVIGIAPRIDAAFSPSEVITLTQTDRAADLDRIQKVIETKIVKNRLEKLGFTAEEIKSKLGQLNDQQIHQLAQKIDDLQVGGNGLGIIIALLVIAILVIVIIQLTGHRVIVQ